MPSPRLPAHRLWTLASLLALIVWTAAAAAAAQSRAIAFTNVTVIDGTGAPPRADLTVVIDGNRISAIGRTADVVVPAGAQQVDGRTKFLIPGLWDMHVHLGAYADGARTLPRLAAYGITGVRDMASPIDDVLRLRRATAAGTVVGPQIVAAGPILQPPLPFPPSPAMRTVTSTDARATVAELQAKGVDFIKVGDVLPRETYLLLAEEARRLGLPLAGHLPPFVPAAEAAQAGHRSIEHFGSAYFRGVLLACSRDETRLTGIVRGVLTATLAGGASPERELNRAEFVNALVDSYDSGKAATLFESFVKNGTWQVPTLAILRVVWDQQRKQLNEQDAAALDRLWTRTLEMFADMRAHGVKVLAGSDMGLGPGVPPLHDELVALVRAGLTPLQAVRTATRDAAEFLGRLDAEGTLEVGKKADAVLLDADPSTDIANTRRVSAVVLNGRLISDAELQRLR